MISSLEPTEVVLRRVGTPNAPATHVRVTPFSFLSLQVV